MKAPGYSRVVLVVFLIFIIQPFALAAKIEIPRAENLAEIARLSREQGLPVLVFVSRDACPYCRTLRDSILGPMYGADKFEQRVILVEVNLDRPDPLSGFDGKPVSARAFAEFYKAAITPTLLFLDADGQELGKRRVGISNLELYGFYLDQSIDDSLLKLAGPE
jgi:thioredoxin-related protein